MATSPQPDFHATLTNFPSPQHQSINTSGLNSTLHQNDALSSNIVMDYADDSGRILTVNVKPKGFGPQNSLNLSAEGTSEDQ